jgi:hypothetical protein
VSRNFNAVDSALDSIQGFSHDERETVVEFLKVGRARVVAGGEGTTAVTVLGDRGFTWPEFDRWQRIFAASGTFPARWKGLHDAPSSRMSAAAITAYRLRKLDLLLEWLDTLRRGATALHHYTRQGIRARIVQQGDGLRCPVCESFNGHEVSLGSDFMPPIHPGCRCVLLAMTEVSLDEPMGLRTRQRVRSPLQGARPIAQKPFRRMQLR